MHGITAVLGFGWHDTVFEHHRILDEPRFAAMLPDGLRLDRHDGAAYLSVVSLRVTRQRLGKVIPLFGARRYVQLNTRVYVRSATQRGVFFLSALVTSRLGAVASRLLYAVPSQRAEIAFAGDDEHVEYLADLGDHRRHLIAGRLGQRLTGHEHDPSSLRHFLVERYVQFSPDGPLAMAAEVRHSPWPLYRCHVEARNDGMIAALGLGAATEPVEEVHLSPGVEAVLGAPYRVHASVGTLGAAPLRVAERR